MIRYPRIYDVHLKPIGDLRTAEITDLKIKQSPLSCVTVTVPTQDIGSFGYRQFVEIFDAAGKRVDLFRVTEIPKGTYSAKGTKKLKCDQVLCTLNDEKTPAYMQLGGNGHPLSACIEQLLACQQTVRWKLGRCDFTTYYEYGFADEGLLSALLMMLAPIPDAQIVTDTTAFPWTLSVVKLTDEDASELRYSRNMEEIDEEILDTDFATRLYPRGYGEGVNQLTIRDVNDGVEYVQSDTAALWGVVSKPYVDTTITDAATLLAQAKTALPLCSNPRVTYTVSARDISQITGEPMDAFYPGHMVRMIYRDYGLVLRTRLAQMHYPKPIAEPWNVKLTLANRAQDVASTIAQLQRSARIQQLYGQGSTTFYSGGIEQNADKDNPAEGDIYIPADMVHINAIQLKVTVSAYRADSKGAAGGGGTVTTTAANSDATRTSRSGGGQTTSSEQTVFTNDGSTGLPLYDGVVKNDTDSGGDHQHDMASHSHDFSDTYSLSWNHTHGAGSGSVTGGVYNYSGKTISISGVTGGATLRTQSGGSHTHRFAHYHNVHINVTIPPIQVTVPSHTHDIDIPGHVHQLTLPDHEHGIVYGIYKGPTAGDYAVEVDGTAVPASAIDSGLVDIAPYLAADDAGKIRRGMFHTIAVRPMASSGNAQGLCHIRASWSAQVFISCQTGMQY